MTNNIEKYLAKKGITIQDLSDKTNIRFETLTKIINGESKLTAKRCEIISNAIGIPVNELLDYNPNNFFGYTLPLYENMNLSTKQHNQVLHLSLMLRQYDRLKEALGD